MTAPRAPQGEHTPVLTSAIASAKAIEVLLEERAALVAALRAFLYARFDQLGQMADHDTLVQQARAALARACDEPTAAGAGGVAMKDMPFDDELDHATQEVIDNWTPLDRDNLARDPLRTLRAIVARVNGVYDDPDLLAFGALQFTNEDVLEMARAALAVADTAL